MSNLEPWALALVIVAAVIVGFLLIGFLVSIWAQGAYGRIKKNLNTACDIDEFVGDKYPPKKTKVVLINKFQLGNRKPSLEQVPLEVVESEHVPGLLVSRKAGTEKPAGKNPRLVQEVLRENDNKAKKPIVVATIRMGFGHHRLAYSVSSWAIANGHTTIFHDLLNIQAPESDLIKLTDELYSKFSRMASEMGGTVEKLWGAAMKSGDADALRAASLMAAHLQPLLLGYPKDTQIITTHQLVALTASAAGFKNVVNLVVDNHPQWFLVVPNTTNIVQGPVNYQSFLKMGVQPRELAWAGHWCPVDMVQNITEDCQRRIQRARAGKPVRILVPVGGAGAQRTFIVEFVRALAPLVKDGKVQLFLNAGDHAHMKTAFLQVLDECSLEFDTIDTTQGVYDFQKTLLDASKEPKKSVTLFSFDEYFPAVATTDIICRVTDVLSCKPSELAFYAVPKLHIRRVGDHEADSALRAAELGDGTVEAREVEDAIKFMELFMKSPDLLVSMNNAIMNNDKIEIYSGCKRAVELSHEGPKK